MTSWRTTLNGCILALGILFTQVGHLTDDDPATQMDLKALFGAVLAVGGALGLGAVSRDNKVSSESVGAK